MTPSDPSHTFHGLPLTAEQEQEIRHYIRVCRRAGKEWDTVELKAMLQDMLDPPELADEDINALAFSMESEHEEATRQEGQDRLGDGESGADGRWGIGPAAPGGPVRV